MLLKIPAAIASRFTNSARTAPETLPASHLGRMPELSLIQILNPVPGGHRFVGHRHALRYIRQKRAQWVGSSTIRFLESDYRHRNAWRTQTAAGYDARGMITLTELKRLPVAGDAVQLLVRRS